MLGGLAWPPRPPQVPPPTQRQQQEEERLVSRLGWRLPAPRPGQQARAVHLRRLSVAMATGLQLGSVRAARRAALRRFAGECISEAAGLAALAAGVAAVEAAQRALWKLRWDNHFKEIYWRLAYDGLATSQRLRQEDQSCACGSAGPGRRHHFWDCPVAAAVRQEVQRGLAAAWASGALRPSHVWTMRQPTGVSRALHTGVWRVVCLAALCAMEVGRKAVAAAHGQRMREERELEQQQQQRQQQQQQPPPGQLVLDGWVQQLPLTAAQQLHNEQLAAARAQQRQQELEQLRQRHTLELEGRLEDIKRSARERFWELLADFVGCGAAPEAWLEQVPADHPFLRVEGRVAGGSPGRLRAVCPGPLAGV